MSDTGQNMIKISEEVVGDDEENPYKFLNTIDYEDFEILDFYFFIAHGSTISTNNTFYPIKTNFSAITFYSKPYETYSETITELLNKNTESEKVCKFIYGSCPKIPIVEDGVTKVYLPPIIFSPEKNDNFHLKPLIGLYHFKVSSEEYNSCKIVHIDKIKTNQKLVSDYLDGITYTDIFGWIEEDCRSKDIDPNDIVVGIMSCQSYVGNLKTTYYGIQSLIPKVRQENLNEIRYKYANSLNEIKNKPISLSVFPNYSICDIIQNKRNQYAMHPSLLTNTTKCASTKSGLELLALHKMIDREEYNEKIICGVDMKYDDIFKVIGYLSNHPLKNKGTYIIIRFPTTMGLYVMLSFLYSLGKEYNYITYYVGKDTPLQSLILCDGNLYYQSIRSNGEIVSENLLNIVTKTPVVTKISNIVTKIEYLNSMLNSDYVDVVFNVNNNEKNIKSYSFDEFLNILKLNNGKVIKPDYMTKSTPENLPKTGRQFSKSWMFDEEIKKGGKKIRKGRKTRKDKKKKNKTRKNKRGGSDLDPFEKVMLELDNKHKNKSVLII